MDPVGALSRLRFEDAASRGRRFPEPTHPYRREFQRDRARIVHSRAFRRLEGKTQVFGSGISDHFRNRLTHTIEAAQISRAAASALGLNEDLAETLALAHDIGHPPFAHAGERELDRLMQGFGDRFNHNLHALRIVEFFEDPYARFPGLNLTFEIREGIVKHSSDLTASDVEFAEYSPGFPPPLEAQLIDLCDEIAYNTADLDDGFAAGLISMDDAASQIPAVAELIEIGETQFPGAPERVKVQEIVRGLVDYLVTGLLSGTVAAAEGVNDVRAHGRRIAGYSTDSGEASLQLKRFLRSRVYESEAVSKPRSSSQAKIRELFEFFVEHPDRMPEGYQEVSATPLHRRVCDYLAGMTDGYLVRTHEQMGL